MYNISNLPTSYIFTWKFAATTNYGDNAYDASVYNGETTQATNNTSGGGALADTGVAILGFTTLACLIVLVAIVVRVWRRPSKRKQNTDVSQR